MNFKIGDKVIVKSVDKIIEINNKTVYKKYGSGYYNHIGSMNVYSNKPFTVKGIDKKFKDYVTLEADNKMYKNDFKWHYEWIRCNNFFSDEDFMI